ncbi:MAG: RNA polymerase sigma-70 factor [Hyphomicrobiales bacterium]|nr:MAG: RNA polymerase sigma-70 factor [Hyphomicrobiales bacterium]
MAASSVGVLPSMSARHEPGAAPAGEGRSKAAKARAYTLLSDEDLLSMIGADDAEAFQALVERHADRAYAIAFRFLRNATDAEDVVQDALLKVWTSGCKWESGRARFSTWLYRVITNRCIDLKRRPTSEAIDVVPEVASEAPSQVNEILRMEASSRLERAIAELPEQQKTALLFSYYENLSNAEIAEIMETTVSAVESLLKRGRQHLRAVLQREGADMLNSLKND